MENKMNFTPEQLELAADTASPAALMALAKEQGIELTAEQAADYYAQLHPENGALSDEELDKVAGGVGRICPRCSSRSLRLIGRKDKNGIYWAECNGCHTRYRTN